MLFLRGENRELCCAFPPVRTLEDVSSAKTNSQLGPNPPSAVCSKLSYQKFLQRFSLPGMKHRGVTLHNVNLHQKGSGSEQLWVFRFGEAAQPHFTGVGRSFKELHIQIKARIEAVDGLPQI